jgi:hypothetical protein
MNAALIIGAVIVGLILLAVILMWPEIVRYLKIRRM